MEEWDEISSPFNWNSRVLDTQFTGNTSDFAIERLVALTHTPSL